jgi:hypothetical protein
MNETLAGLLIGFLTVLLGILRQKRMKSDAPPPPQSLDCEKCFFFREFRRRLHADEERQKGKNDVQKQG